MIDPWMIVIAIHDERLTPPTDHLHAFLDSKEEAQMFLSYLNDKLGLAREQSQLINGYVCPFCGSNSGGKL